MTTNRPSASEQRDGVSDRSEQRTLARTVGATLGTLDWTGVVAGLAGGALLLQGLRTVRRGRWRGLGLAGVGVALVAFGATRRGSDREPRGGGGDVSADAHAEVERPDTDADPRDVSSAPDVGGTAEDEGQIQFTDDQTDDLGDAPGDGNVGESDGDDGVEVDISEAAMADEPGEAAGPSPEQAQPTTTKTDQSPPSDVEEPDVEEDLETGSDDADGDGEAVETEGGAEVHTDAMESGTMDIDEDDVTGEDGEPVDDPGAEELSDDEDADYRASGETAETEETEETEGGAEVHTDANEAGTMDVDEEDVREEED